jgi:hypothetical protein
MFDEIEVFYTTDDDGIHIKCRVCGWYHVAGHGTVLSDLITAAKNH